MEIVKNYCSDVSLVAPSQRTIWYNLIREVFSAANVIDAISWDVTKFWFCRQEKRKALRLHLHGQLMCSHIT